MIVSNRIFQWFVRTFAPHSRRGREAHWNYLVRTIVELPRQRRFDEIDSKLEDAHNWLRSLPRTDQELPSRLVTLADLEHDVGGNASRSEQLYRKALQSAEELFAHSSPKIALPLNSLALLLLRQKRFDESERHFRRLEELVRKNYGEHHVEYATCLENLAALLRQTQRREEAASLREQSNRIRKESLPKTTQDPQS
jgi:tetratricopeptide (TPR) repeat protein